MHVEKTNVSQTEITLSITATSEDLEPIKQNVLKKLARQVKVAGFRAGKVPMQMVEKHIDPNTLQADFLDEAMTMLYGKASEQENVRPVTQPDVTIKKFVPFSTLEFEVKTSVIGPVKLGKYKGLKLTAVEKKVTPNDVTKVLESIRTRMSEKKSVDRVAKQNDEVIMDFSGFNAKNEQIDGANGADYPLTLGSGAFIPGFEDNLVGMKAGQEKSFPLTFPKSYGVKALAGKKVTFRVTVKVVCELTLPKLGDELAAKTGPFKNLAELKEDIKKQLEQEARNEVLRAKQNEALSLVEGKSGVDIPQALIDQQVIYEIEELRRNVTYRGQTYQEFLESEGYPISGGEEKYKQEVIEPRAAGQVKTGIILSEIAVTENLAITPEELEMQMRMLKAQYKDPGMQAELEKPEAKRDIASRMLSQKVVNFMVENAV